MRRHPLGWISKTSRSDPTNSENGAYTLWAWGPAALAYLQTGSPPAVLFFNCPGDIARQRVLHRLLPSRDQGGAVFESRYAEFCLNNPDIVKYFQDEQLLIEVRT